MSKEKVSEVLAIESILNGLQQDELAIDPLEYKLNEQQLLEENRSLLGVVEYKEQKWCVRVVLCCSKKSCRFYKECLHRSCRSEQEAQVVMDYGKNLALLSLEDEPLLDFSAMTWN
ncbi:MAG: hypothetical protein AAF806_08275 [Bacteroidota bacterium]